MHFQTAYGMRNTVQMLQDMQAAWECIEAWFYSTELALK